MRAAYLYIVRRRRRRGYPSTPRRRDAAAGVRAAAATRHLCWRPVNNCSALHHTQTTAYAAITRHILATLIYLDERAYF